MEHRRDYMNLKPETIPSAGDVTRCYVASITQVSKKWTYRSCYLHNWTLAEYVNMWQSISKMFGLIFAMDRLLNNPFWSRTGNIRNTQRTPPPTMIHPLVVENESRQVSAIIPQFITNNSRLGFIN